MTVCLVCGSKEFVVDSGLYYCQECGTQFEKLREEEDDDAATIYSSGSEIRTPKKRKKKVTKKDDDSRAWFTNEAFNIILCNQVQCLINTGVSPALKETVLQIWSSFLRKSEVGFRTAHESKNNWIPSISHSTRNRDAQVLCGLTKLRARKLSKRRKRRKKACKISQQDGTEVDNDLTSAKEEESEAGLEPGKSVSASESDVSSDADVTFEGNGALPKNKLSKCKKSLLFRQSRCNGKSGIKTVMKQRSKSSQRSPDFMSLSKTLCFCYLGLLFIEDFILLGDLLRLVHDGYIPYINAFQFLPDNMKLQQSDRLILSARLVPKMKDLISESTKIAKFIKLPELKHRPLLPIAASFVAALHLPSSLLGMVKRFTSEDPTSSSWYPSESNDSSFILPYEIKAMAYVLVTLKFLFVINDELEFKHSALVREINNLAPEENLFVWEDWFCWLKLQVGFLKSRNISASTICDAMDVDKLALHYHSKMQKWNPKDQPNVPVKCQKQEFRESLRNSLSSYVVRNQARQTQDISTSLVLSAKLKDEIASANLLPQHSSSSVQELPEDFGRQSVSYSSEFRRQSQLSAEVQECFSSLQKLFYNDLMESRLQSKKHKAYSSYWFTKLNKKSVAKTCEILPVNFKWLLNYASDVVQCTICDLYKEVIGIEKKLFIL